MRDVAADVMRWLAAGEDVALATVVAVRGSAPRPPGAKLAVTASGQIAGGVSGGCVEGAVVAAAQELLAGAAPPRLLRFGISDEQALGVGLPCGGEIDVWVERWDPAWHAPFAQLVRADARAALATVLDGPGAGARLLLDLGEEAATGEAALRTRAAARAWGGASGAERVGEALVLVEVHAPAPRLLVFGAIDVADALCAAVRPLGWRPYVIDPRAAFATPARVPHAEQLLVCWPEEGVRRLGGIDRATSVVVLTHDPKIDDPALRLALEADAAYVGAMGSRRAHESRLERLRAAGVPQQRLARLHAPVGLDLGAVTPAETALAIAAELVAVRHGRAGGALRAACGPIHVP